MVGAPEIRQQGHEDGLHVQLAVTDTQQRVRRLVQQIERHIRRHLCPVQHIRQRVHVLRFAGSPGDAAEPWHRLIQHGLPVSRRHHGAVVQSHDTILSLVHQRDGLGQRHGVVYVLAVHIPALAAAAAQHLDQCRIPEGIAAGAQCVEGLAKRLFRLRLGGQPVQFLGQPHDAGDGTDVRALPSFGIAAAVPALHVLLAALPLHPPGDVVRFQRLRLTGTPLFGGQTPLLERRDQLAAVRSVLPVHRHFLRRKIAAPQLVFRRHKRLAQLVVHTAFIGHISELSIHLLRTVSLVPAVSIGAGLHKQHLRIGRHTHRLLPHGGGKSTERLVPCLVFLPFPVLFRHFVTPSRKHTSTPAP